MRPSSSFTSTVSLVPANSGICDIGVRSRVPRSLLGPAQKRQAERPTSAACPARRRSSRTPSATSRTAHERSKGVPTAPFEHPPGSLRRQSRRSNLSVQRAPTNLRARWATHCSYGYVVDKSLGMDNIFVMATVFSYFGIPSLVPQPARRDERRHSRRDSEEQPDQRDVGGGEDVEYRPHDISERARHHEHEQEHRAELLQGMQERARAGRQKVWQEVPAVERWKRNQIEESEGEVELKDPEERLPHRRARQTA